MLNNLILLVDGIEYSSSKISLASMNNDEKVLYCTSDQFHQ